MNSMYPKNPMTQARAAKSSINVSTPVPYPPAETPAKAARKLTGLRRIQVRESGVHGKGVFAVAAIPKGDIVIEYKGDVITWKQAQKRHPHDPSDPNHTFFFHIDDKRVIDGGSNGNAARWINHACKTNCEADEDEDAGRVFIKAKRDIEAGEELFYDYGLVIEGKITKELKKDFECRCGAKKCRGTMLAVPDKKKSKVKAKEKAKAKDKKKKAKKD
jgi:uncharacterized protein